MGWHMPDEEYIKASVKEAELYRSQGLLGESKDKYMEILDFFQKSPRFRSQKKLIEGVRKRIQNLEKDLAAIGEEIGTPLLSQRDQDLIKRLFAVSRNKDAVAIEGAVALAKFGQHEAALQEFRRLLKEGSMPLVAAKNIIRCHLAVLSPDAAIEEFSQWSSDDLLSKEHLKNIRVFLMNVLRKQGIEAKVPEVVEAPSEKPEIKQTEEDIIDICSVRLRLQNGPRKGKMLEFDVTFQSGNVISFIVSAKQKEMVDALNVGIKLPDMEFYSPIAIFRGSGVVSGKTQIKSGPKKGGLMLDIKVDSV